MVLHYSRPKAIFKILLGTACMGVLGYYGYFLVAGLSNSSSATLKGLALLCLPFALIYAWVAASSIKVLRWHGPVLTLDADGISDRRHGEGRIPWHDLAGVHLGQDGNKAALILKFHTLAHAKAHMGRWRLPSAVMNRVLHFGEWFVVLGPLQYDALAVLRTAEGFIAAAHADDVAATP